MSTTQINAGDTRQEIDYDHLKSITNQDFADKVKNSIRKNRPCTFYKLTENDEHIKVHMAIGFYMERHNHTVHTNIFYFQYSKDANTFCSDEFYVHFLKEFATIGITVPD